jgi:hypothetical protein
LDDEGSGCALIEVATISKHAGTRQLLDTPAFGNDIDESLLLF